MNYIGWLAPNGEHYKCNSYEHDYLTLDLLNKYYNINSKDISVFGREDILFNKGWCRISFQTLFSRGYVIQAKWRYITEYQKSFLQKMYFDDNVIMVEQTLNDLKDYNIIDIFENKKLTI